MLLGLVEGDPDYREDPASKVIVKSLNDYNVELELRAWAHDERNHIDLRSRLREAIFKAPTQAGIDMPFETFRVEPVTIQRTSAA